MCVSPVIKWVRLLSASCSVHSGKHADFITAEQSKTKKVMLIVHASLLTGLKRHPWAIVACVMSTEFSFFITDTSDQLYTHLDLLPLHTTSSSKKKLGSIAQCNSIFPLTSSFLFTPSSFFLDSDQAYFLKFFLKVRFRYVIIRLMHLHSEKKYIILLPAKHISKNRYEYRYFRDRYR